MRVRERPRWFKPRLAHWGVEPHRVAEARGETPVAGLLSEHAYACRLTAAAAARQMRGFHAHAHLKLKRKGFKNSQVWSFWCMVCPVAPRTRGFGSTCPCRVAPCCYLWEIQLTYSDSLNACQDFYANSPSAGVASLKGELESKFRGAGEILTVESPV